MSDFDNTETGFGFDSIETGFGVKFDGTYVYTVAGIEGTANDIYSLISRLHFTLELKDVYERKQAAKAKKAAEET